MALRAHVDVNERIVLTYSLTLRIMHGNDQAIHLAGNRIGIDRGYGADGIKVDADVTLLGRRGRNGDPRRGRACGRRFFGFLVVVQNQEERNRHDQGQQDPHDDVQTLMSGNKGRELMVSTDGGMPVNVSGQSESPFSAPNPSQGTARERLRKVQNLGLDSPGSQKGAELTWP
jgi:hypothetical protein